MSRVLLTGGDGSIAIHVIGDQMHNTDNELVLINSYKYKGYGKRLDQTFSDHPDWKERITIIEHDLTAPFNVEIQRKLRNIDHVFHLAALSDVDLSIYNPAWVIQNNVNSTLNLLEWAREKPIKSFIYFSTDEVYGPAEVGHFHKEGEPHQPSNAYAASKAACEDICFAYWRSYGLPLVITNTMNNFGEMQSSSKFPSMVQRALNNGEEVTIHGTEEKIGSRFYIHSRNAASALRFILEKTTPHRHTDGEIDQPDQYNIVGELEYDNLEFAKLIADIMGKELQYKLVDFHAARPGHDRRYALDGSKLRELGWQSPMSLRGSLKSVIEWTQEHPEWL